MVPSLLQRQEGGAQASGRRPCLVTKQRLLGARARCAEELEPLDRRQCAHLRLNFLSGTLKTSKHRKLSYCSLHSLFLLPVSVLTPSGRVSIPRVEAVWGHTVAEAEGLSPGWARRWGRRVGVGLPAQLGAGSSPVGHPAAPRPHRARRRMACSAWSLSHGFVLSFDVLFHCVHPQKGTRGSEALERPGCRRSGRTGRGLRASLVHLRASCRKAGRVPTGGDGRLVAAREGVAGAPLGLLGSGHRRRRTLTETPSSFPQGALSERAPLAVHRARGWAGQPPGVLSLPRQPYLLRDEGASDWQHPHTEQSRTHTKLD